MAESPLPDVFKDIERAMTLLRDRGAEMRAFESTLNQVAASLADIVDLMEKPSGERKPLDMAPLVNAIKGLSIAAPAINFSPEIKIPEQKAPTVVMPAANEWTVLKISIDQRDGPPRIMTITKSK